MWAGMNNKNPSVDTHSPLITYGERVKVQERTSKETRGTAHYAPTLTKLRHTIQLDGIIKHNLLRHFRRDLGKVFLNHFK